MAKRFGEFGRRINAPPGGITERRAALCRRSIAATTCRSAPMVEATASDPSGCGLARLLLALLAVAGALALPSRSARAQVYTLADAAALIRFVHASSAVPSLDFHVDGALLVQGLVFGAATDVFISLSAGPHTLQAIFADGDAAGVVAEGSIDLSAGAAYDVAVIGLFPAAFIEVYPVDTSAPSDGRARLRLIACAPDVAVAGLAGLGNQGPIEGVAFPGASHYVEVESGVYEPTLLLIGGGQETTVELGGVAFDGGAIYDLFVVGLVADGSLSVLVVRAQPFDDTGP